MFDQKPISSKFIYVKIVEIVKIKLNITYNISGLMPQCSCFESWCMKTGWLRGEPTVKFRARASSGHYMEFLIISDRKMYNSRPL